MKSPSAEWVLYILVQILFYYGYVICRYPTNFSLGKQSQETYFQVGMITGHLEIQNGCL